ncbi:site-specific integrase [Microbacteriaceae bacterium VKM Ac-2854]|nr:site-specific integrase [Microbacteriaceae bacterium VKM Ac-2854]
MTRKAQRVGRTFAAAENALREALRDRLAPSAEYLTRDSTLADLAQRWLDDIESSKRAPATLQRYRGTVSKHVNSSIGSLRIREVTTARLDRFVDRVAKSSGTAQAKMLCVVLSGMMQFAQRHDAIASNPAEAVRVESPERADVRAPTLDEVKVLRQALRDYDAVTQRRSDNVRELADFGDLLLATGCRPGEALALQWADVDLDQGRVTVRATLTRTDDGLIRKPKTKTRSGLRVLSLPAFALEMLKRRHAVAYCEWVFPSAHGTARWPANVITQWAAAVKGTSVEWTTPGSCRKAVATLLTAEFGLDAAKEQLGHSNVGVTSRSYVDRPTRRPDRGAELDTFGEQNSE